MNTHNLPKMLYSYSEGWQDVIQVHPSVSKMFASYVVPMSLIPSVMFLYSMLVTPGSVFPALVPEISFLEALAVAGTFFFVQLAMVALMASVIQQMGDVVDVKPGFEDAYMLAAIAPTPLWLSSLALFVPVMWFNALIGAVAWVASAALIFHGVEPLFKLENHSKSRLMASFILMAGVIAWAALLVVLTLLLSLAIGLR